MGRFALLALIFIGGGTFFGYVFLSTTLSLLAGQQSAPSQPPIATSATRSANVLEMPDSQAALPADEWKNDDRLSVLLLGLDQRDDQHIQATRSDTMIVLTIDPIAKTAALMHIPRDLWVVIPGYGENKINTANFLGDLERNGNGPLLAQRTVEMAFGIRTQYHARVDFRGFERLIDAVGGVTIDAPRPVKDDEYPDGDHGVRRIYIPSGIQHLDGAVALQYARSRHQDSDLARGQRQTQVLVAAKNQAMRLDMLPKLPSLIGILRNAVTTDIPFGDFPALINLGRQIDGSSVVTREIGPEMTNDIYGDGTVLIPKWDVIKELVGQLFYDPKLKAEHATVAVVNGTLHDGLAAAMATALTNRAFKVDSVSQAVRSDYRETVILDHTGKIYTVDKLAQLLHVQPGNIRNEPAARADITLVLGLDAKLP